jgi:hypothetical protein
MKFSVRTPIQAPPARVWALLTDAAAYPEWNSTVIGIDGEIARGSRIALTARVQPKRAFNLTVEELEDGDSKRMVWADGMPLGLFRGARSIEVVPTDEGCEFAMEEEFTGLMAPLITKMIPDLQPSFDQWAADLKATAEAG